MEISYLSKARKQIKKIPKRELKKIISKIERLAEDPDAGKVLKGEFEGFLSYRAWPYRIIYKIEKKVLVVCSVAHRQGVYK